MSEDKLPFSEKRIQICRQCKEYHLYRCRMCGCFMPVKVRLASVRCPLGKWGPEGGK